jgi:hypothetical protein
MSISWGTITWYLFHGLAEKIKEDKFEEKRSEIVGLIVKICKLLPCPECSDHAQHTLSFAKLQNLKTKEDLQKFLWGFHNIVNQRRRVEIFNFDECKEKYSKIKLESVVDTFIKVWSKNYAVKLMNDSFHRRLFTNKFKIWFQSNKDHFSLE